MNVGTLADLGKVEGMPSVPTLGRFIAARSDFPVIQHGRYGKPYVLDLDAAAAFVRQHWRDGRNERRRLRVAAITAPEIQPSLFDYQINHLEQEHTHVD